LNCRCTDFLVCDHREATTILQRRDTSFTADFEEMDTLLRVASDHIFGLYRAFREPAWAPFAARFGCYSQRPIAARLG